MDLILTVIRYQNLPSPQALTVRIGVAGGTIGRNPDNDLALPDPDRWVGRQHARIGFRDGTFFLTDTSKNGTFVNQATVPLHTGQEVELHDGDELGIGAYEIRVSLDVARPQTLEPFDPFADRESEPLAPTPSGHPAPDILDLVKGTPAEGETPLPPPEKQEAPVSFDDWPTPEAVEQEPWTLGTEREPPPTPAQATEPDHTPDENAFYSAPEAIPENYDIWADESRPQPKAQDTTTGEPEPKAARIAPISPPREEEQLPPAAAPEEIREKPAPPAAAADAEALASFLAGLGTGEIPADPQAQTRLMRTSGQLLRAMTEGLIRVMMGRARFKKELGVVMTVIERTKNNPFKFSVDAEDAVAHLLFRPSRGFLQPVEATREAFDDIQCHEMAMIAGLRAALRALLARMDPAELEKRFQDRSLIDSLMPMARKAKCWDLFTSTYDEISADAADDFMHLFNDAFAAAYEDQASRLRQARLLDQSAPDER